MLTVEKKKLSYSKAGVNPCFNFISGGNKWIGINLHKNL